MFLHRRCARSVTVPGAASTTRDYSLAQVPVVGGQFQVKMGHSYIVVAQVATKTAPLYAYAAPAGVQPGPAVASMVSIGTNRWAIQTTITRAMGRYKNWTLGVKANGVLHDIPVTIVN